VQVVFRQLGARLFHPASCLSARSLSRRSRPCLCHSRGRTPV
jgi:hypothetical protein